MAWSQSSPRSARRALPPDTAATSSLLRDLAADYPDLSAAALAQALDRAHESAAALAPRGQVTGSRVEVFARDRLDALRERANRDHRVAAHRFPLPAQRPHANGVGRGPVPCTYCRHPIPPDSFVYWSDTGLLLSATCPTCRRQTTMRAAIWARLSEPGAYTDQRSAQAPSAR